MELDIKHILRTLWKRKIFIMAVTLIAVLASAYYSYTILVPQYEASTKLIVNKTRIVEGESNLNINDLNANIQLIQTYKELIRTDWITQDVLKLHPEFKLTPHELLTKIKVSSMNNTQVMTISVTDPSYSQAADLVNAITNIFVKKIPNLYQIDNVTLLTAADRNLHPAPVEPNRLLNLIIAGMAALVVSIGGAFVLQHFDDRILEEEDVEIAVGAHVLAIIPYIRRQDVRRRSSKASSKNEVSPSKGGEVYEATQR
ncbi:YveK family protein [Paenibacillus alvei]|uniref:YveK family protein n=1 Tax=Paenibacillus alvei TaxID=44250 RepID=UPI0018CDF866|nr:Wzz/FepE/Etk N-terminal domain-containing protein [Paenibacillus alvei]MBG9737706.1 hypothetical protein [Paenibacillus alvei]MBG9747398.1 hypothetical protein [Paenibacillus alvei]MCY9581090.1 Wzz/FepE/Etk N-terminal domain-containing protein [Paenibacillus alvei]MCY9585808.1 Wzz/FepE/Etk N-terminal domain-containing protein [Paenibacillus alvei]